MSERKLRVLMLGWEFPPLLTGGLGTACYGLCKALSEYCDITLVLPRTDKNLALNNIKFIGVNHVGTEDGEHINVEGEPYEVFSEVIYVDHDGLNPYPLGIAYSKFETPVRNLEYVRALYNTNESYGANIMEKVATYADVVSEIALSKEFDIIHAHDWITYPAGVRIKLATNKPLVLHVHSLETDRIGTHAKHTINAVYEIEKKAMELADRLIPVSYYTKDCAVQHYGIDPGKFFPVYNAIDPIPTYRIEREFDEKVVLFLGRITFQKGPDFMAETAFKLLQRYPKVKFFVAGVGDQLEKLKASTESLGIANKFIFAGFLNKQRVHQVLAQADVYFMPSVSEPFGLSALEAAQFEIPTVLSIQSGVAEVMPHALKADYWDTDKFANYIYALLNYNGIRKDLTTNTSATLEDMTWDDSAKEVMLVYKTIDVDLSAEATETAEPEATEAEL